uniref:Uncharacterized protein n=1 Tax=Micrurus surinamensis TaxID=129470 RepID=A0A2D4PIA4_MICSU
MQNLHPGYLMQMHKLQHHTTMCVLSVSPLLTKALVPPTSLEISTPLYLPIPTHKGATQCIKVHKLSWKAPDIPQHLCSTSFCWQALLGVVVLTEVWMVTVLYPYTIKNKGRLRSYC